MFASVHSLLSDLMLKFLSSQFFIKTLEHKLIFNREKAFQDEKVNHNEKQKMFMLKPVVMHIKSGFDMYSNHTNSSHLYA